MNAEPRAVVQIIWWVGGGAAAAGAAYLVFSGRGALVLPGLLFLLPLVRRFVGGDGAANTRLTPGQTSSVATDTLEMMLDHDSGSMRGRVLRGKYSGRALEQMTLAEILDLLEECKPIDVEAATLLEAYLDRIHGGAWRERSSQDQDERDPGTSARSSMSRSEALEILGLGADAGEEEIRAAHRRLMLKLHPDTGGSTYLAAKINQAKDVLVGE
ncbi:MAG: molecular chaperone DnaJ [Alphaproteobacteria bacterium]|nr:molecular chaperone DnaJ [Alphaproteobacteria bacterium]